VLEKLLVWRNCHEPGGQVHAQAGLLILGGDGAPNFIGDVAIALIHTACH
jgi:hypothetical protein